MSTESEFELEKKLINQLISLGYKLVKVSNQEELKENFRNQLFEHNKEKLLNVPFSDGEFQRVLNHLDGSNIFYSAKKLRDKFILIRDDETQVYIEFFNTNQWCQNIFQVSHQVKDDGLYSHRYDVTLLINGLPLVQIELKKRGIEINEAINQIERYRKQSYTGLFKYIQFFVVSNGIDTKYMANSDTPLSKDFAFYWSDDQNNRITNLSGFVLYFLERCQVAKMIARYMVLNDTDKRLMIMRPYQVYAVENLVRRATETHNNGYIWHTTGSGKTLTSFKASQIIASEPSVKKVFFLVDRKDLDAQTIQEFNKFDKGSVDTTDRTDVLVKQIGEIDRHLIVTTIQKLSKAVNNSRYAKIMDAYKDERVVFIIDECHRSQFGDMHRDINKHFKNAQYFGFTGTPRLEENASQDGRTTANIFGKCLHKYLIKDAIKDHNVLGFSVEYIDTINFKPINTDIKVQSINTDEALINDTRIKMIANHIVENHDRRTNNRHYNSILAVDSIEMLIKYYDAFKFINTDLKITAIFTYGANEDPTKNLEHSRQAMDRIMIDYNNLFDSNYSTEDFSSYFTDVTKRMKRNQIDILIVVNMLLTGFDSKLLKVLYVDKNLQYHGLMQAFSRTNRIESSNKPYGNIVCYRNLKENTDNAIALFSNGDLADNEVIFLPYQEYVQQFKEQLDKLHKIASTVDDVNKLESEDDIKEFILTFRELSKILVKMKPFEEFEFTKDTIGMDEQDYLDFKSKYLDVYRDTTKPEKVSILGDIDFCIELMHTDTINVAYILNLLRTIDFTSQKTMEKDIKNIRDILNKSDDDNLHLKADLIRNFLDKINISFSDKSIDEIFNQYLDEVRKNEITEFAQSVNIDPKFILKNIMQFEYSGILDHSLISDGIKKPFLIKKKICNQICDFIEENVKKYN